MYGEESTYTSGMNVYTTLDYKLQVHAEEVVKKAIELGEKVWIKGEKVENLNFNEAALLSVDQEMVILVMQGGPILKILNLTERFNRSSTWVDI